MLEIRLAKFEDLENINILFSEVIKDINNIKKINMWNDIYPFCELEKDIKNQEMYVVLKTGKIIGSFTIGKYDDPDYHVINWTTNNKKWFYINRLVVLPSEQGKGYAKIIMEYILNYAKNNEYDVIRLTVHIDNIYAINLYEKYGFIRIENSFWRIAEKVFIGFEKYLNKDELILNLDKIHTTELGIIRIKKNLGLETDDIVNYCKNKIKESSNIIKKGKNFYIFANDFIITVNSYSYTIITAHKIKEGKNYERY